MSRLFVTSSSQARPLSTGPSDRVITTAQLLKLGPFSALKELRKGRYDAVQVHVKDFTLIRRLLPFTLMGSVPRARERWLTDDEGHSRRFSRLSVILRDAAPVVLLDVPVLALSTVVEGFLAVGTKLLARKLLKAGKTAVPLTSGSRPYRVCYLATDPVLASNYGGAAAHRDGVLGGFLNLGCRVVVAAPFDIPADTGLPQIRLAPLRFTTGVRRMSGLLGGYLAYWSGRRSIAAWRPDFIYQRYYNMDISGALLATKMGVPFVLEYNGSFSWMSRNWGGRELRLAGLSDLIEQVNFALADLIVVVSKAMKDSVVALGVPPEKVLVNPNCVDPETYWAERYREEAVQIRDGLGIPRDRIVICFIGTFGRWHGAEVLARAVRPVVEQRPNTHFLFIGNGNTFAEVVAQIEQDGMKDHATFTGAVPKDEAIRYMAVADIYSSPHVPNADGTAFFGSPTKLFEYMAMGRAIVASNLDQIGEVLSHNETALLVEPGNVGETAEAMIALIDDPGLRQRLGSRARQVALERYTWDRNVERVLEHLEAACARQPVAVPR